MKTNVKLVAGGIAAMLMPIVTGIAFFVWAEGAGAPVAEAPNGERSSVQAVGSPRLEPELAATHRPSTGPAAAPPEPSEAPTSEPASYEATLDATGPIRLRRLVVSTGVRDHEPVGTDDRLEVGAQRRVYAFVDAINDTRHATSLRVTFEPPEGESVGHVALGVPAGAPRWRTWAWTRHVDTPGRWHAVVHGPDGRELGRRPFDVVR